MIRKINDTYVKVDTRMEVIGKIVYKDNTHIVLDSDDRFKNNKWTRLWIWIKKADRETGKFLNLEVGTNYKVNFSFMDDVWKNKIEVKGLLNSAEEFNAMDEFGTVEDSLIFQQEDQAPMFRIQGTIKRKENSETMFLTSPTDDWGIMVEHADGANIEPGEVKALGRVRWFMSNTRRLARVFVIHHLEYVDKKK